MRTLLRNAFHPAFFCCAFSLLALSVPAAGAAAPVVAGASVAITDSALTPKTVTIPVGGSVQWTNSGTRSHEVVAYHAAFKSFSLAPANSKRVTFSRAGPYPYLVDGKTKGAVFVVPRYGAVERPSGTGPHNCHPTILHYDIDVETHTDDKRTDPRQQGMEGSVIDWKAHWANAAMSVDRCHGGVTVLIPDVQQPWAVPDEDTNKLIVADTKTFDWTDTTQFGQEVVPPCHFTNVSTFRAGMFLQGKLYGSVGSDFQFFAARRGGPREQDCAPNPGGTSRHAGTGAGLGQGYDHSRPGYVPINGLDFAFYSLSVELHKHSESGLVFPISALVAGKGFTFNSGELRTQDEGGIVLTTQWATVRVSPVHP